MKKLPATFTALSAWPLQSSILNSFCQHNLVFSEDYCKFTPLKVNKAKEIVIELIISAPKNYKQSQDIKWKKVWRKDGLHAETFQFIDGSEFPARSKLQSWLSNIRFVYVPAIRGATYFESLLAQLHDTLAETIEEELRDAGDSFISMIKKKTEGMINGIGQRLSLNSEIRLPPNLQSLFKTLDFSTTEGAHNISLGNRGDGIKTRHIPPILKFIAEQLNANRTKGAANVNMIWGYEEPENNLELTVAFQLAQEFVEYSKDIQILITTHSAAFYAIKHQVPSDSILFRVHKPKESAAIIDPVIGDTDSIDQEMGLMPIVAPYINAKLSEINKLRKEILENRNELSQYTKNTLFVEGNDEVRVFKNLIEYEGLADIIAVSRESFGCSGVKQQLMSWSWQMGYSKIKVLGLFDNDSSGKQEKGKLMKDEQFKRASKEGVVKAIEYSPILHLSNIKKAIPIFPIELEEMYPISIWRHCEDKDFWHC